MKSAIAHRTEQILDIIGDRTTVRADEFDHFNNQQIVANIMARMGYHRTFSHNTVFYQQIGTKFEPKTRKGKDLTKLFIGARKKGAKK